MKLPNKLPFCKFADNTFFHHPHNKKLDMSKNNRTFARFLEAILSFDNMFMPCFICKQSNYIISINQTITNHEKRNFSIKFSLHLSRLRRESTRV